MQHNVFFGLFYGLWALSFAFLGDLGGTLRFCVYPTQSGLHMLVLDSNHSAAKKKNAIQEPELKAIVLQNFTVQVSLESQTRSLTRKKQTLKPKFKALPESQTPPEIHSS